MTKVVWTLQASEDPTRVRDYIRTDSFQYADLVVAEVFAAVDLYDNAESSTDGGA